MDKRGKFVSTSWKNAQSEPRWSKTSLLQTVASSFADLHLANHRPLSKTIHKYDSMLRRQRYGIWYDLWEGIGTRLIQGQSQ